MSASSLHLAGSSGYRLVHLRRLLLSSYKLMPEKTMAMFQALAALQLRWSSRPRCTPATAITQPQLLINKFIQFQFDSPYNSLQHGSSPESAQHPVCVSRRLSKSIVCYLPDLCSCCSALLISAQKLLIQGDPGPSRQARRRAAGQEARITALQASAAAAAARERHVLDQASARLQENPLRDPFVLLFATAQPA